MVNPKGTFRSKLEKLETWVDTLLEERRTLKEDFRAIQERIQDGDGEGEIDLAQPLDDLRTRLAETDAVNQKYQREREMIKSRLRQLRDRLDLIEAKLLEQRSPGGKH